MLTLYPISLMPIILNHSSNCIRFVLALCICCLSAFAKQRADVAVYRGNADSVSGTVYGVVTESGTGEMVVGATVSFFRDSIVPGKAAERGAYTNRYGHYSVRGLTRGTYTMVVSNVGYKPYVHTIHHGENVRDTNGTHNSVNNVDIRIDVRLELSDINSAEVVVTAERDRPAIERISTVTLTPDFIKDMPSLGGEADVFRVLQLLPGVQSASEISSGLYIRGGSPDQNLILLDGVVVYNPTHLGGFLSSFYADALRDVKLIKGVLPAEYGGRLAAVVDITMKEGNVEAVHGSGHISLISAGITADGPVDSTMTFMVSGRRFYGDLIASAFVPPDEMPTYYFYDLNLKLNKRFGKDDRLFVSGYFGRDVLGSPVSDFDSFDVYWGNSTANIRWTHILNPEIFISTSVIYTDYNFGFDARETDYIDATTTNTTRFASSSRIRDVAVKSELEWFLADDHLVKSGIDVTHHRFGSGATGEIDEDLNKFINTTTIDALDVSFFAQDEWKIRENLKTNLGGRLYYFNQGNWLRLEPRISIAYEFVSNHTVTTSFAVAHQFLHLVSRNDLALPTDVWFPSTSNVLPSRSEQAVIGYQTTFNDGMFLFTVESYYKSMSNLIEYKDDVQFTLGVPLENQFTSGSGEAYGIEFFLNKRIGDFTGWVGYTLAWSTRTFAELNNGKTFFPRYDRRHDISVTFQYRLFEDLRFSATWVYATGQAYTVPAGQYMYDPLWNGSTRDFYTGRNAWRLASFHKLDVSLTHELTLFGLQSELILSIYNVYNRLNPFALYTENRYNPNTGASERVIKQLTLFPIIPSLGLRFKF